MFSHIPAGGKRSIHEAMEWKRLGLAKSWPDLILLHQTRLRGIEFKAEGEYPTKDQKDVFRDFSRQGVEIVVCKSLNEFVRICNNWGLWRYKLAEMWEKTGLEQTKPPRKRRSKVAAFGFSDPAPEQLALDTQPGQGGSVSGSGSICPMGPFTR